MVEKYFENQIREELEGAKEYIKMALRFKHSRPKWAVSFSEMSKIELGHAESLYKMWNEYADEEMKKYPDNSSIYRYQDKVMDMYVSCRAEIVSMHDIFNAS